MTDVATALSLGLFLGLRHAADPDHVVAIGAMSRDSRGARSAMARGAFWGLGHAATVLAVGGALVLFGLELPASLQRVASWVVVLLLIGLGVAAWRARALDAPVPHASRSAARALTVGVAHGLAGSAATALLALGAIGEPVAAIAYLALFGLGTIVGMVVISGALWLPLRAVEGSERARTWLARGAGLASVAVGVWVAIDLLA